MNENVFFSTFMHRDSHKNYKYGGFIQYHTVGKTLTHVFLKSYFLGNKMLHIKRQAGLRGPDPCSCCPTCVSFTCSIFFAYFSVWPFVLIITKISHQMAIKKPTHDVVDMQSLGSRHQMNMLRHWIFYIGVAVHAALRNPHTALYYKYSTCCSELVIDYWSMLFWVINMLCWITIARCSE